jgi:hypothetical protein
LRLVFSGKKERKEERKEEGEDCPPILHLSPLFFA